ncbi:MAG: toxin-antitoxin system HicB family antitoxin [Actinomycetota bacterium]|nr:toxin-antitoxin system HicB family antitoxin [Actinomycetota bacterium]
MELSPYIERLRDDLVAACAAGGPEVARTAELIAGALSPATRMVLLDSLGDAADEITAALGEGSVEVRLRSGEPEFVLTVAEPARPAAPSETNEETTRLTLRLPESLKARAEQAAAREGLSVNAWLVRAVAQGLEAPTTSRSHGPRRFTGYARS